MNCNRGTALERPVGKLLGMEGLNQFYLLETSPLILTQLQITKIHSVRKEILYLICETSQWNTYNKKNTAVKQNKWFNGYLKPECKKTTNRSSMSPTTDIDS